MGTKRKEEKEEEKKKIQSIFSVILENNPV